MNSSYANFQQQYSPPDKQNSLESQLFAVLVLALLMFFMGVGGRVALEQMMTVADGTLQEASNYARWNGN